MTVQGQGDSAPTMLVVEALTEAERGERETLEAQVEQGLNALYEIRQRRLWRDFPSFSAYMTSRWGEESVRRKNQLLAGLRVFDLLKDVLGEGAALPESEYSVRPIVTLSSIDPQKAVEVYQRAVALAEGAAPSQAQVLEARQQVMSEKEIRAEDARRQLENSPYYHLKLDLLGGGDPLKLLAIADTLTAAEPEVRRQMVIMDIHDPVLIRMVNEQYQKQANHLVSLFRSQTLYFADGSTLDFRKASPRDYRRFLDELRLEHIRQVADMKRGEPVSIVVFYNDIEGTLRSLEEVLTSPDLLCLAKLILKKNERSE